MENQTPSGGSSRSRGGRLEEELGRWTAASIITVDQADAIRRLESGEVRAAPPKSHIPLVAEALGFLGGALAVAAGVVAIARFWGDFSTAARLIVVGAAAALLVAMGRVVRREGEPALDHLGSFLWALATGATAFWVYVLLANAMGWGGAGLLGTIGLATAGLAAALWVWRPAPLQHAATFAAAAVAVAGIASHVQHIGGRFIGISLWAFGLAWVILTWRRLIKPAWLGYAAGGLLAVVAGQVIGTNQVWPDVLAILTGLALLAASVPDRSMVLLWVGAIGVFVSVAFAVVDHFAHSLGAPVALFLAGVVLIGVAVAVSRLVHEVRAAPRERVGLSRTRVAAGLSGVVILVVGLTVGLTDVKAVPSFPSLRQTPDPAIAGSIAFSRSDGDKGCVYVVAASGAGAERRLLCEKGLDQGADPIAWNSDGHIVAHAMGREPQAIEIDPGSGAVVSRQAYQPGFKGGLASRAGRASDGTTVEMSDSRSGHPTVVLRSPSGATRTVLAPDGPSDYQFRDATWSPDGRYLAVVDSESRLLIVDVEAATPGGRLLTKHVQGPAWGS